MSNPDATASHLAIEGISKGFPGVRALTDVSFDVAAGSVHALMGENGAGKSTLLKVLSGVNIPDQGRLLIGGQERRFRSTSDALKAGVAVIYQELHLVPELSVAENIYLGHLPANAGWVDRRTLRENAAKLLAELGEDGIDPAAKVSSLPIGQRQIVEITKALTREATIIAFDEPTSSLSSRETERLFEVIRSLRARGRAILYVSHRMDEIETICDAATVLRDGRHVRTFNSLAGVRRDEIVQAMVGRKIEDVFRYRPRSHGEVALDVQGVIGPGVRQPVSFQVRQGEIFGLFGLIGAGRTELLKLIYGADRMSAGCVRLGKKEFRFRQPREAIRNGVVLCPEDRKRDGIIPTASVMDNLNIHARKQFSPLKFFIHPKNERFHASSEVARLSIKTPSLMQKIKLLSGGNQQKVILARWLSLDVRVVLLDEPTRGIDVGAKSEIYSIIYQLAEKGVAVVMVSSELPEAMGVCDRVGVMREGALSGIVSRAEATQEQIIGMALPEEAVNLPGTTI